MTITSPRTRIAALAAASLVLLAIAVPGSASAATTCANRNAQLSTTQIQKVEDSILCVANNERRARGLKPLRFNGKLAAAARGHSEDMVLRRYLSHTTPDGDTVGDRIVEQNYSADFWGEIIGSSAKTPAGAVAAWMKSSDLRAKVLRVQFDEIGIGVARSGSGAKYTVVFASPVGPVGPGRTGLEAQFQG